MLLALIISPILLYFVVLIPGVQNKVGNVIINRLSNDWGTDVSIENVRFYPLKKIVVREFLIKDNTNDTLLFADKVTASLDSLDFTNKQIYLGTLTLANINARFLNNSLQNNYSFILDSILNKGSKNNKWKYNLREIKLKNGLLSYKKNTQTQSRTKFNPNNIDIHSLNLHIDQFKNYDTGFSFRINKFSAKEKSGLKIKKGKGKILFGNNDFELKNFLIQADHSFVSIEKFKIKLDSSLKKQLSELPLELDINSLSADYKECKLFLYNFPKLQDRINLRGHISGTLSQLKGRNISINAGSKTELETNFDISGLPNIRDSYLYLNVKHLKTNIYDIIKLMSLNKNSNSFTLPESFNQIEDIEYNGKFSGFIDNLVAYGSFKTNLGNINTDLGIKFTNDNKLVYSGFINTQSFNLGKLMNSRDNLNKVTMDVSVKGYKSNKNEFNSYISGSIDSIDVNGYKYEKLILNGLLSSKKFNGKLKLNDPNLQLSFNGKINFSNDVPQFDFDASINNMRLDKLNLVPKLTHSNISVKLNSNLTGNSINTLTGKTIVHNGKINVKDNEYLLDSLSIIANQSEEFKEILVNSDLLEGSISGKYNLTSIPNLIKNNLSKYLPSLFTTNNKSDYVDEFSFNFQTKKLSQLLQALSIDINLSDGSYIYGSIDGSNDFIQFKGNSNKINYKSFIGENLNIEISTSSNKATTNINCDIIGINNFIPVNNLKIFQQAFNDSILTNVHWDNKKTKLNQGSIFTQTKIRRNDDGKLYTKLAILPSQIIIKDSIWKIQACEFFLSPMGIKADAFRIYHLNQEINVNGALYNNAQSKLTAYIQNINLKEISSSLKIKRLSFDGLLNGFVQLKNGFKHPIITSDISLEKFRINNEDVGNMIVRSKWSNLQKAVLVNTDIKRGNINPLRGIGYFKPSTKDFNFNFKLDSLPLGFINLYTSKVIQNLKGTGSGNISLVKTNYGLGLDGAIKVNKANFDVDLLKCSFSIEDTVKFSPESIYFNNMTLTDPNGRTGKFNGEIWHRNFINMNFDLYVHANNMLLLNTKEEDNPLYYGTVNATGDLAVTGTTFDLNLDINGKTESNTKFYIPISDNEESLDNKFIRFVNNVDTSNISSIKVDDDYEVDLSNFTLNMGVEITPDAQVQVIFDPTVGDVLKSWGKGNLQIQMNKEGDVSFFGEYIADKGDYLFSLENIINKRFDINNGGTVIWEGDPYDAIIDITATYKLKTSIQPLISSSGESDRTGELSNRIPINCDLILGGRLSQPKIGFNISAPTLEQSNQNLISEVINSEEELNRQVFSLLALNKFYTPSYRTSNTQTGGVSSNIANTYTYELLSDQLSNIVTQMINDVDVGISYRPEDEISSEQIEVALSTQIFNDRVTLNGNVEYGKTNRLNANQNSNNIVGDFDLDVKLNKSGSLRAKAYTHSNDDFSFDSSPTTQGVGISYQEEFNTVGELLRKYWNWITGKAKKEEETKLQIDKETVNNSL